MRKRFATICTVIGLAGVLAAPAFAQTQQEPRYQQWQDPAAQTGGPNGGPDRTQDLIDKLTPLIDDAERTRAADPRFLRDLRAAIRDFDRPWRVEVLYDDFRDGDYQTNPAWQVTAGKFWVETNFGLRSAITPPAAPAAGQEQPQQQQKTTQKEQLTKLFGQILNQAINEGQKQGAAPPPPAAPDTAAIQVPVKISTAFAITLELSSWQPKGRLDFGPYQGNAETGYRLIYTPGAEPALTLVRASPRGAATIETAEKLVLEDQRQHRLDWTRSPDGTMVVTVDGTELMRTVDRYYAQPFDGFRLVNRGGDYILRSIRIAGTE
jgi:hypothetical protein